MLKFLSALVLYIFSRDFHGHPLPKIFDLTQKSYRNSYRFSNMHTLTSARCVQRFNVSQILQFTLRIAFCCVLHRCESQEIHCQKLFLILFSCYKCFFKWMALPNKMFVHAVSPLFQQCQTHMNSELLRVLPSELLQ